MSFLRKTRDIGIDFGTSNTAIYLKGKGIVLKEPSVVAINNKTKGVVAVGEKARVMIGKTPRNMSTISPIKSGAIADFGTTQDMIKSFREKVIEKKFDINKIVACCPAGVTDVEKRAIDGLASEYGTKEVVLIDESMAAAIGANLPIDKAIGSMMVVIGAGVTEVSVISLDGIVRSTSLRVGGDRFDEAIMDHIKTKYKLRIGKLTAENIKIELGSAIRDKGKEKDMQVKGVDLRWGMPKAILITESEIREALRGLVENIINSIKETLEDTPPELASDIIDNGIMIAGGGALLKGLDKKISKETKIEVHIAEDPMDCVALGIGKLVEYDYKLRKYKS